MSLYESVISNLKGVVGSNKDGIPLSRITDEYQYITGSRFPLRDLGYDSVMAFLKSVPRLFRVQYSSSGYRVHCVVDARTESETNLALMEMIQNTVPKKGSKFKKFNIIRRTDSSNGFECRSNFSYSKYQEEVPHFTSFLAPFHKNSSRFRLTASDEEIIRNPPAVTSVECQTIDRPTRTKVRSLATLKPVDIIHAIIDLILECRSLNLDSIVYSRVTPDLYHHFSRFTGLFIDPFLFHDILTSVLSTSKDWSDFYEDLVCYSDDSKKFCCLNLSIIDWARVSLPNLEFSSTQSSFLVDVLSSDRDKVVSVRFSEESSAEQLRWNKMDRLSDRKRDVIECERFCAWVPGSGCLVQLPVALVKQYRVTEVERAVILSVELIGASDPCQTTHVGASGDRDSLGTDILMHRVSFYLIDHELIVHDCPCTASSFQSVRRTSHRPLESRVARVCSMSIRARCMPAKIQFFDIDNYSDVAHLISDRHNNRTLIIYQISRIPGRVKNFQPVFRCYARFNRSETERNRVLEQYGDDKEKPAHKPIDKPVNVPTHITISSSSSSCVSNNEVIVISDSEDEHEDVKIKSVSQPLQQEKTEMIREPIITRDDISVISFTEDEEELEETLDGNGNGDDGNYEEEEAELIDMFSGESVAPVAVDESKTETCVVPITSELRGIFEGKVVTLRHLHNGTAVIVMLDSSAMVRRELRMMSIGHQQPLRRLDMTEWPAVAIGDYFLWFPTKEIDYIKTYNCQRFTLVEILQVIKTDMALVALIHHGLVVTVKLNELCHIPNYNNNNKSRDYKVTDKNESAAYLQELIGPIIGAFDLHMIPNWYSADISESQSNTLFTAFFINDNELVLEYFDNPCRFLNFELLSSIERNLMTNHCNTRSKSFITMLSQHLLHCRLFVGSLLVASIAADSDLSANGLSSIMRALTHVTSDDKPEIWFASVNIETESGELKEKLSPHCLIDGKFCIDRVQFDKSKSQLRLLDYQNITIDIPDYFEGIYKFDQNLMSQFMKSSSEFDCRYKMMGAVTIPDLHSLCNKLIF